MKVVFGSRGSDLALAQTKTIMKRFRQLHPQIETELRIVKTTGDNRPDAPLSEIGGLGAFTREIELALLNSLIDVAVHSLKDLPTEQPAGLRVAAVAGRERPTDTLVSNAGYTLDTLPRNALVGTSSLRRKAQLLALRPDLRIAELRGNVPTRLGRVRNGDFDAVLLATAGLRRVGLGNESGCWEIPLPMMLPAPGQGALALETRSEDDALLSLLQPLHDTDAETAVNCERSVLAIFGGGCRAPLGAHAVIEKGRLYLQAMAMNLDSGETMRVSLDSATEVAEALGCQAGALLRDAVKTVKKKRVASKATATDSPTLCGTASPLHNRRVVITRARDQAVSLGRCLEEAGALVLYAPLIAVEAIPDAPIPAPGEPFDWVVFTSANTVRYFNQRLQQAGRALREYRDCRVAAIGHVTEIFLKYHELDAEIVPVSQVSEGLVEAILQAEPAPKGKRVLLPQSMQARPVIAESLRRAGMEVVPYGIYHTVSSPLSQEDLYALTGFAPDCITFFSPSAVKSYVEGGACDALQRGGDRMLHASIGPVTTDALRQAGCPNIVEAASQNEQALCETLIQTFQR